MTVARRTVLATGLAAAVAAVAGGGAPGRPAPAISGGGPGAGPSPSPSPSTVVGSPSYEDSLRATLTRFLAPTPENPRHPTYAGAVALALAGDRVSAEVVVGDALRYRAGPVLLPAGQRVAMR